MVHGLVAQLRALVMLTACTIPLTLTYMQLYGSFEMAQTVLVRCVVIFKSESVLIDPTFAAY